MQVGISDRTGISLDDAILARSSMRETPVLGPRKANMIGGDMSLKAFLDSKNVRTVEEDVFKIPKSKKLEELM